MHTQLQCLYGSLTYQAWAWLHWASCPPEGPQHVRSWAYCAPPPHTSGAASCHYGSALTHDLNDTNNNIDNITINNK